MEEMLAEIPAAYLKKLKEACRVLVITGAGVSAESGVPTFRGDDGIWRNLNAMDLASPEGFKRNPKLVWEWYLERREGIRKAEPNPAHQALAALEHRIPEMIIATQNVDGLHQRAGSKKIEEVHGSIWRTRCTKTGEEFEDGEIPVEGETIPPLSPSGNLLRPAVVWFGEMLPIYPIRVIEQFIDKAVDVVMVIGTSALFGYIVDWALRPQQAGALLIEVNPKPSDLSRHADLVFKKPASEIVPGLCELIGSGATAF